MVSLISTATSSKTMFVAQHRPRANPHPNLRSNDQFTHDSYVGPHGSLLASTSTQLSFGADQNSSDYADALIFGTNDHGQSPLANHQLNAERHLDQLDNTSGDSDIFQDIYTTVPTQPKITIPNGMPLNTDHLSFDGFDTEVEPASAISKPDFSHSSPSEGSSSPQQPDPSDSAPPPRTRKSRREKPRIELAANQPPTTQGKPRARVYVACVQCRARKIRCDGAKPTCFNCSKRTTGSKECDYDAVPKRRGPDKMPGGRQRVPKDSNESGDGVGPVRRRRRSRADTAASESTSLNLDTSINRTNAVGRRSRSDSSSDVPSSLPDLSPLGENNPLLSSPEEVSTVPEFLRMMEPFLTGNGVNQANGGFLDKSFDYNDPFFLGGLVPPTGSGYPLTSELALGFAALTSGDDQDDEAPRISYEPTLDFSRKIWWDSLLSLYLFPSATDRQAVSASQRDIAARGITSDIRFLFRESNYWFSFFHAPTFFRNFFDPTRRQQMQPSLVLAMLALSTFWQSSDVGFGRTGRERALRLRDEAQAALDASFNVGWIDETLAHAAWLLALFEVCAHPLHSSERSNSSMVMLDSLIRGLSLTFVDADDPNTNIFSPGDVPAVPENPFPWVTDSPLSAGLSPSDFTLSSLLPGSGTELEPTPCNCRSLTLGESRPESQEHTPLWSSTPAWGNTWDETEIRKESCRRLCWSSIILAAGRASYSSANGGNILPLFIADPSNYALLFSGESIAYSPSLNQSSKDTIWALHDRCFLLWHGCIKMRNDAAATDIAKAQFAGKAWLEADALEAALNRHTCGIERSFIFQAREYIFNIRMCISHEFQRFIPLVTANVSGLFHRNKAKEWLTHQAHVAERIMLGLSAVTGHARNLLARRPFFVFWFMGQVSRALSLWERDHSLVVAMDVCKALLPAIDYLTALWPCPEQRYRYKHLRQRLCNACLVAGVDPPPPANLELPSDQSNLTLI